MCKGSKAEMACGHVVTHFSSPCGKKCTTPTGPTTYLNSYCERCDTEPMRQKREARKAELRIQFGLDKKPGETSSSSKITEPPYLSSGGSEYAKHKWGGRSNSFAHPRSRKAPWDAGSDSDSDDGRRDTAHLTEDGKHVIQKEYKLVNGHWALIAFRKELDEVNPILLHKLRMKREKEREKIEEKRKRKELKRWVKECREHDERVRREEKQRLETVEEEKHAVEGRGRDRKGKGVEREKTTSSTPDSSPPASLPPTRSSPRTSESHISRHSTKTDTSRCATATSTSRHSPTTSTSLDAIMIDTSRLATEASASRRTPETSTSRHSPEIKKQRHATTTEISRRATGSNTSPHSPTKPSTSRHPTKTTTTPSPKTLPKKQPERSVHSGLKKHPPLSALTPPPSPPTDLASFHQKANLSREITELSLAGPIFDGTQLSAHKPLSSECSFRARRARLESRQDYEPTRRRSNRTRYRSRSVPPRGSSKRHPWPNEVVGNNKKEEEEGVVYEYDADTDSPRAGGTKAGKSGSSGKGRGGGSGKMVSKMEDEEYLDVWERIADED